ncbi:MAG: alpha/beta fold hydrolase, partial [Cyanobacteria bacterium J06597_16]
YDTQQLTENAIAQVANTYSNHLKALIQHCLNVQANSFTPSDFPEVAFTQAELDRLIGQVRSKEKQKTRDQEKFANRIDAIYPLAPLQQAFLWHALQTSSVSGLLHMRGTLHGDLDAALLQQAWQHMIARHRALRSAVYWQNIQEPVQVAIAQPAIPWQQLDYRAQPNPRQALADFLSRDRALGFDFTQAPITRLALIQLGDREHELVWTCHHLMLDGWSGTFVINQVLATYQQIKHGQPIPNDPVTHYQSYIHWLNQQDELATQRFWQATLKGFTTPTPLPLSPSPTLSPAAAIPRSTPLDLHLSKAQTNTLQTFLRSHRLTLNTLIQGTWALLLSLTSQQPDSLPDVLFGATVSGRQAPLAEVESIVGLLTNVVPVRVQIPPTETALSWLQALQTQQAQASRYAHADPTKIQAWSECHRRLFNSLLVIENYPANTAENTQEDNPQDGTSLQLENLRSGIISTYSLTIIVKPGETLALFVEAQGADNKPLMALLSTLKALLNTVVEKPETNLSQIIAYTKAQAKEHLKSLHERPERKKSGQKAASALERNTEEAVGAIASTHDLPKTPLERQLTQIWETVLGHSPLGVETSFFEVGGDSLLAVQLFNQMQQQVQCDLPLATLFQAPTIRQFAALLNQRTVESATHSSTYQSDASQKNTSSKWSSLVPVQAGGTRRPLFFHGGSADALTWARFSRLLGPDQPFYALQRPDLDGRHITDISVEALAEACIKDIKTIQPTGPYLIGGHCFGGAVAFEIARQLQTQGEITSSLIQIDAYCPNAVPNTFTGHLQEQLQIGLFLLRKSYYYHASPQKLLQLPGKIWQRLLPRFQAKSSAKPTSTQISIQRPTPAQYPQQSQPEKTHSQTPYPQTPHSQTIGSPVASPQTTQLAYEDRYALAHQANLSAAEQYRPQHYPPLNNSPLHIFQAKAQILDWRYGPFLGWKTVSDSAITTTTIPGLFGNLFNQRSGPLLAQQVKAHLDTLQPAQPSPSTSLSIHSSPPDPAVQIQ